VSGPPRPAGGRVIRPVPPRDPIPSAHEIGDRARLAGEVTGSLEKVRATAESWRTGMAGLVTLVTATLLFKGHDTISDYDAWVRYALGALTSAALLLAVVSLWLFLSAAYGRMRPVSAQSIVDEGGPDVRNVQLATTALTDLKWARRLALCSAALLAGGLVLSWYGPTRADGPLAFARIVLRAPSDAVCGELLGQNGTTTVVKVAGWPGARRIATRRLASVVLVANC
jgi:hypothetical protein